MVARGEGMPVDVTEQGAVVSSRWSAVVAGRGALLSLALLVVALGVSALAIAPAFAGRAGSAGHEAADIGHGYHGDAQR